MLKQPQDTRNADGLAGLLNTSARALQRQLKEEGATPQALQDEARRERTMALLQRSSKPVKQLAEAARFQDDKSFFRAFQGLRGMAPGEWRIKK